MSTKQLIRTIAELAGRFPAFVVGKQRPPLKLGIHRDLAAAAPDMDAGRLGRALRWYVNGKHYMAGMTEGAVRIGLDGTRAGIVTAIEAQHARGRLNAMRRRHAKAAATPMTAAAPAAPKVVRPAKAAAPKTSDRRPAVKGLSLEGLRQAAKTRRARPSPSSQQEHTT
jgi:ProP effector